MFLPTTFLTLVTCLNIGLSFATWNKIPYSVDYSQKPYKRIPILASVPTPTVAAILPDSSNLNLKPSTLLSRSGFIGGDDEPIYVVKRGRFRPSYKVKDTGYTDYGRWSLGGLGGGGGGDDDGHGGVFMLGGGNRRRQTEPEHISVYYKDQGYGYGGSGGWHPPPPKKKTHSSHYLTTPTHEKPGFVQKLIPIPMIPIKGKLSEIITWFSDPHGHRHGFNRHHEKHEHGHGWHK